MTPEDIEKLMQTGADPLNEMLHRPRGLTVMRFTLQ